MCRHDVATLLVLFFTELSLVTELSLFTERTLFTELTLSVTNVSPLRGLL
jgi:hypothetical protein